MPLALEPFFHAAELDILVPAVGSFPAPPSDVRERAAWWESLRALPRRDTAFLDEKVAYAVSLRIPSDALPSSSPSPSSAHTSSAPPPPPELAALAKYLQITATASFLPPLAPPAPQDFSDSGNLAPPPPVAKDRRASTPSTPISVQGGRSGTTSPTKHRPLPLSPPRDAPSPAVGTPNASLTADWPPPTPASAASLVQGRPPVPEAGEGGPPLTPRPLPATSPGAEDYADIEGVTVWEGAVEVDGESRPTLVHGEDGWSAVWRGEMTVVYVRTQIANPVLGITASATLRATKPRKAGGGNASDTASIRSVGTTTTVHTDDVDIEEEPEEDMDLAHMEEIDLLGGLAANIVSASRLGPVLLEDLSISSPRATTPRPSTSAAPVQLSIGSGTTMRKSFRRVLGLSPGLRVRMRTLFLPQLLPPGVGESNPDDSEDTAERKVVLCVEVENGADSGEYSFEVECVTVDVGGKGGMATVELICQPGMDTLGTPTPPSLPGSPGMPKPSVFPLQLAALEQYNLLYGVTIASSPGAEREVPRTKSEENRPVSIVLTGRPFRRNGTISFPTASFQSRWNCNLDLAPFYATLPPAPPPPPAPAAPRQHRLSKPVVQAPNAIAGDKRYALANLLNNDAPNRRLVTNPPRPNSNMPLQMQGRVVSTRGGPLPAAVGDGHGLLVSVRLLSPGASSVGIGIAPAPAEAGSIYPLDTFSIEVFVHNRTDSVRRFRLGVPARDPLDARIKDLWNRRRRKGADEATYGVDDAVLGALLSQYEAAAPALIPLETDVRCGPLLPGASLAARIRFLALRDGVHRIERLRLTGMGDEFDFAISPVLEVVVAQKAT